MKAETVTSKLDEIRNGSMRWWGKRGDEGRHRLTASIDRLAEQMRKRYGYTRDKAELEVSHFLDRYDHKVHEIVESLPGDLDRRVSRYPWATIATVLGLGLLVGFIIKPGR